VIKRLLRPLWLGLIVLGTFSVLSDIGSGGWSELGALLQHHVGEARR